MAMPDLAPSPAPDAAHVARLAEMIGSQPEQMPPEFFAEIDALARQMGPERLAEFTGGGVA